MTTHTLNALAEEAIARAVNARAIAIKKREEEDQAYAKMEEEFKASQVQFLSQLLPNETFQELGVDLANFAKQAANKYNYNVTGEFSFRSQGNEYKAGVSIIASYPSSNKENNKPNTVYLNIEDKSVKLYLPDHPPQYRELNLIALSEALREIVEDSKVSAARAYEDKKRRVWRSLNAEGLTSERCEEFVKKLDKCTWPEEDVKELLERAKIRLESIKAREADVEHDKKLLGAIWEMAQVHVAEWEEYSEDCRQWAELMTKKHWHPFTLFAVRYEVSDKNTETAYCLSDKPDEEGYLKVVTPDGHIIHKRFCRPISWQKETFNVRPDIYNESYCHYQIHTGCSSFTINLPPASVHSGEVNPVAISESQPEQPISWLQQTSEIENLFINKGWGKRALSVDPENIASEEMSTWFQKRA